MRVYLIRHTRPDIGDGVCYGQADIALADSFEMEKEEIRRRMQGLEAPQIVYSSPSYRCAHLAGTLTRSQVLIDERLREFAFGEWELQNWADIERADLDAWAADLLEHSPPRGENLKMFYARVCNWITYLLRQPWKTSAVVTHAGVIRCFHVYAAGIDLVDMFAVTVEHGDIFQLEISPADGSRTITSVPRRKY